MIALDDVQLAAITVLVACASLQRKRASVEECEQTLPCNIPCTVFGAQAGYRFPGRRQRRPGY